MILRLPHVDSSLPLHCRTGYGYCLGCICDYGLVTARTAVHGCWIRFVYGLPLHTVYRVWLPFPGCRCRLLYARYVSTLHRSRTFVTRLVTFVAGWFVICTILPFAFTGCTHARTLVATRLLRWDSFYVWLQFICCTWLHRTVLPAVCVALIVPVG